MTGGIITLNRQSYDWLRSSFILLRILNTSSIRQHHFCRHLTFPNHTFPSVARFPWLLIQVQDHLSCSNLKLVETWCTTVVLHYHQEDRSPRRLSNLPFILCILNLGTNSQAYEIKTFSNSVSMPPRRSVKNSTNSGPYCSNRAHLARSSAACLLETEEVPTVSIACASCWKKTLFRASLVKCSPLSSKYDPNWSKYPHLT